MTVTNQDPKVGPANDNPKPHLLGKYLFEGLILTVGALCMLWVAWAGEFPTMLWSLTQDPAQVTIAEIENQGIPTQLNWTLTGCRPAADNWLPDVHIDDGDEAGPRGYYLPLKSSGDKPADDGAAAIPVVVAWIPIDGNQIELMADVQNGELNGYRPTLAELLSDQSREKLVGLFPNNAPEDFIVFCAGASLAKRASILGAIFSLFALIYGWGVWDLRRKYCKDLRLAEKASVLSSGSVESDPRVVGDLELVSQQLDKFKQSELLTEFDPPPLEQIAEMHPVASLCSLAVCLVLHLAALFGAIIFGGRFLENNNWLGLTVVLLASIVVWRISRRFMAYCSLREPSELSKWLPEPSLKITDSDFYQYHSWILKCTGFELVGESSTRHFFSGSQSNLLVVLGRERRAGADYFSFLSVFEHGEIVQTSSATSRLHRRSLYHPRWLVNRADKMTFAQALELHREKIEKLARKSHWKQYSIRKSSYRSVIEYVDKVYDRAWAGLLRNTWLRI